MRLREIYLAGICLASFMVPAALAAKAPTTDTLRVDITASIANRCGVAALGSRSNDGGRIDQATSVAFNFRLDCNSPFKIGVATENGALRLVSEDTGSRNADGFAVQKNYKVGLSFMTDQDGLIDAGLCDSEKLSASNPTCAFYGAQPGSGFSPGRHTTAIGRDGALTVEWSGEEDEPVRLAAGAYQDVITVVVGPRT